MSLRKLSESQWNLLMAHYGEPETRERWGGTVPNSFEAASANAARAAAGVDAASRSAMFAPSSPISVPAAYRTAQHRHSPQATGNSLDHHDGRTTLRCFDFRDANVSALQIGGFARKHTSIRLGAVRRRRVVVPISCVASVPRDWHYAVGFA